MADKKIKSGGQLTKESKELIENPNATIKDYYNLLSDVNKYENYYKDRAFGIGGMLTDMPVTRARILEDMDKKFPNRNLSDKQSQTTAKYRTPFFEDGQPFTEDLVKLALVEGKLKKAAKEKEEKTSNLGFFGKMLETLKTDADARQKFLDQVGSIGAEISRPTDPGEARGLVRDVIVGSQKGEGKTIAKRKAESEYLADVALAQQRANPMQYYTTTMKELTQQAIAEGFDPGTRAFTKYIGARLRDKNISEDAATYSETLRNLNEQLMAANASGDQKQVDVILEQIAKVQNLLNVTLGGTDASSSNVVPYQPQ